MPKNALLAALAALLAAGCATPCEELGHRICQCTASGSPRNTCEDTIDRQLADADPDDAFCEDRLDTCEEPSGESFCDWILSEEGKVACGLAYPSDP
jgi:hypothetical protein